ncbi:MULTISPECIES: CbtB domain-containing protein [Marinobacter]|uniref:CbtB domain-containing protein n=1 Tax=Marinobacter TaxID=2742 RepID=UPI00200529FE|nr:MULTISPECIES: CbtB domain-containing protein [Marinobacter]MCK7545873.1 CbtB-domain containing protein [Marinobacter bryozoorum]
MSATSSPSASGSSVPAVKSFSLIQQGAVLLFGALILFGVGFLPMAEAHNAAHDTRHSFVFPCH